MASRRFGFLPKSDFTKIMESTPYSPYCSTTRNTKVIAGNGRILEIQGWVILKLQVAGRTVFHECGIVKDLPISFIIGGEFMKPHGCTLQ